MTREDAIEYFKFHRKIFCEEHLKICPKNSIAYQATLKEKEFYDMAIKALEEPKTGHWIKSNIGGAKVCSVCNAHMGLSSFKFCPSCGAKMVEPQESEDKS